MKVAILGTRGIPQKYGGFETLAQELGVRLAAKGHTVTVYTRTGYGYPKAEQIAPNLNSIRTWTINRKSLESLVAGVTAAVHTAFVLRPDVVLFCNPSNYWAMSFLKLFGIPGVLHMAGLEYKRVKWTGLGAFVLRLATRSAVKSRLCLLSDSEAVADWYLLTFRRSIETIKYGVNVPLENPDVMKKYGLTPHRYFLVVARWDEDNQVAEIIEAHRKSGSEFDLVVVGYESRNDEYVNRIHAEIRQNERALSLGAVWNQAELSAIYAGAYGYIHGHSAGGTNPALLLGAASGAHCLVHDNPFNREVVTDLARLWKSSDALSQQIHELSENKKAKSDVLVENIVARYSWDAVADQYEVLLNSVRRKS